MAENYLKVVNEMLAPIPGDSMIEKVKNLIEASQGPPPVAINPGELYQGKTALQWCEIATDLESAMERLKQNEPSPGQALANRMAAGRAEINAGKVGA